MTRTYVFTATGAAGSEVPLRDYAGKVLLIVNVASNGPGTGEEIQDFCKTTYDVTSPSFSKIEVNGPGADPLYQLPAYPGTRRLRPRVRRLL